MFSQHFIECVFHFNSYERHEKYNRFPQSERSVNRGLSSFLTSTGGRVHFPGMNAIGFLQGEAPLFPGGQSEQGEADAHLQVPAGALHGRAEVQHHFEDQPERPW